MSNIIPRPQGHHAVVPSAIVNGAGKVIAFLERAFGGKVVDRYDGPNGAVYHAEVLLGDSVVMLGEPPLGKGALPAVLTFYVDDAQEVEATYRRALELGAETVYEPMTQPWGYRAACVADAGGNRWTICAIVEEVSHDEIVRRMQKAS